MKSILFRFCILTQIIIILYLALVISMKYKNNQQNLYSINTFNKAKIIFGSNKKLTHYYEPKPDSEETISHNWLQEKALYTINSDALNERFNYSIKKREKTFRIITLGNSFTFGQNVSTSKNFTELLEDELNKSYRCSNINLYEVINLGMGGYDFEYMTERYRLRGKKYSPDMVIVTFHGMTGFQEDSLSLADEYMKLPKSKIIKLLNAEFQHKTNKLIDINGYDNMIMELARNHIFKSLSNHEVLMKLKSTLSRIRDLLPKNKLIIQISDDPTDQRLFSQLFQDKRVGEYIENYTFKDEYRFPDYHLNIEGNREMAFKVIESLNFLKLLPCNK